MIHIKYYYQYLILLSITLQLNVTWSIPHSKKKRKELQPSPHELMSRAPTDEIDANWVPHTCGPM